MSAQTVFSKKSHNLPSQNFDSKYAYTSRPLKIKGCVNIDNISDKEYELLQELAEDSIRRQIEWKPQSFFSIVTALLAKKTPELIYSASHKGFNVTLTDSIKGKISIKITKGITKKTVLETFIPFKPEVSYGKRRGSARSVLLYNLYKSARYQVDGELLAS